MWHSRERIERRVVPRKIRAAGERLAIESEGSLVEPETLSPP